MSLADEKAAWRRWARLAVRPASVECHSSVARGLAELLDSTPGRVLTYWSLPGEIDLRPLAQHVDADRLLLTRSHPDRSLTVHRADSEMEPHGYGFMQPVAHSEAVDPATIAVVLVPGLVFDRAGTRLGRGAGYYDRFLAGMNNTLIVGVTRTATIVHRLPLEAHDVAMTHLASQDGVNEISMD